MSQYKTNHYYNDEDSLTIIYHNIEDNAGTVQVLFLINGYSNDLYTGKSKTTAERVFEQFKKLYIPLR